MSQLYKGNEDSLYEMVITELIYISGIMFSTPEQVLVN